MSLQDDLDRLMPGWFIEETLGEGGFGSVYKVRKDSALGNSAYAALKVVNIPRSDYEARERRVSGMSDEEVSTYYDERAKNLAGEVDVMLSLKGAPNIVSIEEQAAERNPSGTGWRIYIRMELLDTLVGYQLSDRSGADSSGQLPESEIMRLGVALCRALSTCHGEGIIHRDIKPSNIFVDRFDNFKLGDFGIARQLESPSNRMSTNAGTDLFVAPEVAMGGYDLTVDIYSLGLVLYWLANRGRMPFMGSCTEGEALSRRLRGEALPAPNSCSGELAGVILKACAFDPDERYQSANDMGKALEAILANSTARPASPDGPTIYPFEIAKKKPKPQKETFVAAATAADSPTAPEKAPAPPMDAYIKDSFLVFEDAKPKKTEKQIPSQTTTTAEPKLQKKKNDLTTREETVYLTEKQMESGCTIMLTVSGWQVSVTIPPHATEGRMIQRGVLPKTTLYDEDLWVVIRKKEDEARSKPQNQAASSSASTSALKTRSTVLSLRPCEMKAGGVHFHNAFDTSLNIDIPANTKPGQQITLKNVLPKSDQYDENLIVTVRPCINHGFGATWLFILGLLTAGAGIYATIQNGSTFSILLLLPLIASFIAIFLNSRTKAFNELCKAKDTEVVSTITIASLCLLLYCIFMILGEAYAGFNMQDSASFVGPNTGFAMGAITFGWTACACVRTLRDSISFNSMLKGNS